MKASERSFPSSRRRGVGGFTLVEMMIASAVSVLVIGGLLLSSLAMQKALGGSDKFASAYSDQRRLIDFIGRDLRRGLAVAATDESGSRSEVRNGTVPIEERKTLIISLPAYYRSEVKYSAEFDQPLDVVGTDERLDYGTEETGLAGAVEVVFRKIYLAKEGCVCFVRQEAAAEEVIVRNAENLFAEVTVNGDAQTSAIKAWFRSPYSGSAAPLVTTYDQLLLRNPPLDLRP